MFTEILPQIKTHNDHDYMEVYVAEVKPDCCGSLMKQLSLALPLKSTSCCRHDEEHTKAIKVDLSHLKRVRRTTITDRDIHPPEAHHEIGSIASPPSVKRPRRSGAPSHESRNNFRLEILLGAVSTLDAMFKDGTAPSRLQTMFEVGSVYKTKVPGRAAESEKEHKEFQAVWPIVFFANKTKESRERERELSHDELTQMIDGMKEALKDADEFGNKSKPCTAGTVIVDPRNGHVLARSSDERGKQSNQAMQNPLNTSVILAIQHMSRRERETAMSHGLDSTTFQSGQYLCTGCDAYTTLEPTPFEAMALVHARIRRVVFGCKRMDALGGLSELMVHSLPGTNHKYRAFMSDAESEIGSACQKLQEALDTPLASNIFGRET